VNFSSVDNSGSSYTYVHVLAISFTPEWSYTSCCSRWAYRACSSVGYETGWKILARYYWQYW